MVRVVFVAAVVLMLASGGVRAREDDALMPALGQTWAEIGGEVYGAKPDALGPIGGGQGYQRLLTTGQYQVATIDELLAALQKARAGETVFIDPKAELDLTALVYAEGLVIGVPSGVTLASNRGQDGSPGALLYSEAFQTAPLIKALGPDVRVTGLRVRGPDPKVREDHHQRAYGRGRETGAASAYYYKLPNSNGLSTAFPKLEVDNCEISGWSNGGVDLTDGTGHHVHHCYIHHNQRLGLGYGVVLGYGTQVTGLIEFNVFDRNRHSIAATGKPGNGYEACNNVEFGHATSHYFDMHGGSDRGDGTTIAGDWLKIHHNTFRDASRQALRIRGVPQQEAVIDHNWFAAPEPGTGAMGPWPAGGETHVRVLNNAYGADQPAVKDRP